MERSFDTFVGIDLGGGKGKNTAVAILGRGDNGLEVLEVGTQSADGPWYDEALLELCGRHAGPGTVCAIDAPLTLTSCVRCREQVCPGMEACIDPTIIWFRTAGAELLAPALAERDQIAFIPSGKGSRRVSEAPPARKPPATPYTQRATEVFLARVHGVLPRETLGQGMGPLTARAAHLVKALARHGYALNQNLLEVYPKATLHKLFGAKVARSYKREADTWETRARILEQLAADLGFARGSGMARETCLRNDHCFDAVVCAYTAFLWARDGWKMPEDPVFTADGWIWTPFDAV